MAIEFAGHKDMLSDAMEATATIKAKPKRRKHRWVEVGGRYWYCTVCMRKLMLDKHGYVKRRDQIITQCGGEAARPKPKPPKAKVYPPITISEFSAMNLARCEHPKGFNHAVDSWSLSDWMTALTGEVGEAANIVKKLNRRRDGTPGNAEHETREYLLVGLRKELSDAFIYLDIMMKAAGGDTHTEVLAKWHASSKKIGYKPRRK